MDKQKPALVIMAAGMGSRFGGLKQIEPVDPEGHIIIDFLCLIAGVRGSATLCLSSSARWKQNSGRALATVWSGISMCLMYIRTLTVCRRALKFRKDGRSRGGLVTRWPAAGVR